MKPTRHAFVSSLAALGLALHGAAAFSARPPAVVSGSVSSIDGQQIVVNGTPYDVQLQGGALQQLQHVRVGDQVDLVLTSSPGDAAPQVSAIHVHPKR